MKTHDNTFATPASRFLLVAALILVAINLRPALTTVGPVLGAIRIDTGLSAAGAGALTTLPVLLFGLIAPLGPLLARRFAVERVVVGGLLALTCAAALRMFFGLPGLFIGTVLVGASIGVVMVLLPGIIKRDFADRVGTMTGLYSMALCLGAAIAAGVAVPIQELAGGDWRVSLGIWAIPALLGALLWAVATGKRASRVAGQQVHVRGMWSSTLAWQVALFMGLQSTLAYCVFAWLPSILVDRGFTPAAAGAALSISIAVQLVTALGGPWLATRGRDQRGAVVFTMVATVGGLLACMYAPIGQIWLWAALLGLGQGACFSVSMMLVVLRAPSAQAVASLSGMSQLVGYVLAACGPLLAGMARDISGDWDLAAAFFVFCGLAGTMVGIGAGRARHVQATIEPAGA